ncbi:MAG TPA: NADH-quinone oxidoreductase subunit NuoH [Phycisphaerales bacterium]|nr:NADH-quinone oxidoreductase subunit NuoH [Phycisphaerales bacterium]
MIIMLVIMLIFLALAALVLIWLERKISARIQNRMGPMLTGPGMLKNGSMWTGGLFQTIADAIKLLLKELIIPGRADPVPFVLAPVLIFGVCVSAFLVIPFAPALSVADLNIGILYVISVSSLTVLSIIMAGWSSNNKYSLLGGLRSAAQMLSYEIPLLFALLGPIVMAETLSMQGIVKAQHDMGVWFVVPSFLGCVIYYVAAIAEVNRPPFDIPEAESELVAGYVSEYSGMMFAMFFLAEFCNMMLVSAIATTVFLGGWAVPFMPLPDEPTLLYSLVGAAVFFVKMSALILLMMWIRWTFPRVRPDHLMNLGWKFMLPLAFINLMICAGVAILDVETEGKMGALPIWGIGIVSLGIVAWALSLFKEKEGQAYDVMSTQQEVAK